MSGSNRLIHLGRVTHSRYANGAFVKLASAERIELSHWLLESRSPNPWNMGGYHKLISWQSMIAPDACSR